VEAQNVLYRNRYINATNSDPKVCLTYSQGDIDHVVIWPTDSFQGDVDPKVILGKHGCVNRVTAELTAVDGADTWRSYNVTSVLVSDSAV